MSFILVLVTSLLALQFMKHSFQPLLEDEVLLALYQDQLAEIPFKIFLHALKQRLGLIIASLDIGIGKNNIAPISLVFPPHVIQEQIASYKASQQLWHMYPRKASVQAGDIYRLDEVAERDWKNKPYYQKCMLPLGVSNEWVMAVSGPDDVICLLRLSVDEKTVFEDSHRQFLQQLRPHLERALIMHMRIRRPPSIINLLDNFSDSLGVGFFILNGHRQVISSNNIAKYIAQHEPYLSLVDNQIRFSGGSDYNRSFSHFIDSVMRWRDEQYGRYVTLGAENYEAQKENHPIPSNILRIERKNDSPVDILVQALRPHILYRNETSAQVVIYIVSNHSGFTISVQLITKLYQLTPSEAQFAKLLANGYSITGAAKCLKLTNNSARTYSKRIYSKTGVSSQAELVHLLLNSVARLAD